MSKTSKIIFGSIAGILYVLSWIMSIVNFGVLGAATCFALTVSISFGLLCLFTAFDKPQQREFTDLGRWLTSNRGYYRVDYIWDRKLDMHYQVSTYKHQNDKNRPSFTVAISRIDKHGEIQAIYESHEYKNLDKAISAHANLYNKFLDVQERKK